MANSTESRANRLSNTRLDGAWRVVRGALFSGYLIHPAHRLLRDAYYSTRVQARAKTMCARNLSSDGETNDSKVRSPESSVGVSPRPSG